MEPSPKPKYRRTDPKLASIRKSAHWTKRAKYKRSAASRALSDEINAFYKDKKK